MQAYEVVVLTIKASDSRFTLVDQLALEKVTLKGVFLKCSS
jgi:hypothetical protein